MGCEMTSSVHYLRINYRQLLTQLYSAYKSSTADALLAERGRIESSHRMTDDVLEYACPCIIPLQS